MSNFLPILHKSIADRLEAISEDVLQMSEDDLEANINVTKQLRSLRSRFNQLAVEAQVSGAKISGSDMCKGIVHPNYFYTIIKDPYKLAYIIYPIQEIEDELMAMRTSCLSGLWDMVNEGPHSDKQAPKDFLKAAETVLARTDPVVNRVEQKSMSVSIDQKMSESEIDARLNKLIEQRKVKEIEDKRSK